MQEIEAVSRYNHKQIDSELFSGNLAGVPSHVAPQIMKNASRTLGTVSEYLRRAKEAKEKMQFRVKWKISERNETDLIENNSIPDNDRNTKTAPIWVELSEHPGDDSEKIENTLKAFFDAKDILQDQRGSFGKRILTLWLIFLCHFLIFLKFKTSHYELCLVAKFN